MGYKVGDQTNLGSEANVRLNGNRSRLPDGKIPTPTIGHKGQEGSDPNFLDTSDHIITTIDVEENDQQVLNIRRKCSCGLSWEFKDFLERRNIFDKEN